MSESSPAAAGEAPPTAFMMCDIPSVEAWWRTPPGVEARARETRVTEVPATIQPSREVGLAQESRR